MNRFEDYLTYKFGSSVITESPDHHLLVINERDDIKGLLYVTSHNLISGRQARAGEQMAITAGIPFRVVRYSPDILTNPDSLLNVQGTVIRKSEYRQWIKDTYHVSCNCSAPSINKHLSTDFFAFDREVGYTKMDIDAMITNTQGMVTDLIELKTVSRGYSLQLRGAYGSCLNSYRHLSTLGSMICAGTWMISHQPTEFYNGKCAVGLFNGKTYPRNNNRMVEGCYDFMTAREACNIIHELS